MRTTLDLPDETFRQLKAQAALNGLKLKELVTQLIQRGLANGEPATAPAQQAENLPVAIKRVPGSPLSPALTNAQLYALLDEEDMAQHQKVIKPSGSLQ
jgi:hypothetical protein